MPHRQGTVEQIKISKVVHRRLKLFTRTRAALGFSTSMRAVADDAILLYLKHAIRAVDHAAEKQTAES